ncbi:MAG: hypothetical protein FWG87_10855 [Defluviitaleaceae bacterium]|nr:hypothetical protein [Defluviitaleaceae bacterium]
MRHTIDIYRTERLFNKTFGIYDGDLIDIRLYGKYEVDTSGIREANSIVGGTPFTYFFQARRANAWNYGDLHFIELDSELEEFQNKYFAVSFGREIEEIRRTGKNYYFYFNVAVTFAEEYQGDVMFIYLMDELHFYLETACEYYIMNGSERVYVGTTSYDLNERIQRY